MKKLIISFICIIAMICPSHAQEKIVGDMNDDGKLNIADLTLFVNTLLGKTAQKKITSGGSDQTTLLGTWAEEDGTTMKFSSGGVATISDKSDVTSYEYYPDKGNLAFYNSDNILVIAYQVKSISSTCIIICEAGSTYQRTFYSTSSYATSISMSASSAILFIGQSCKLSLVASPEGAHMYYAIWSSSNPSVATFSFSDKKVTGISNGTATITAETLDGKTATCMVTVRKPVESVTFPYTKLNIPVGSTYAIPYKVEPYDASVQMLSWTSNKPAITSVSNGVVTANAVGYTTITATTTDGTNLKASCAIQSINATPTGLTLSKPAGTSLTLAPAATLQLTANIAPTTASSLSIIWSSSNESVATVDKNGKVTAKMIGGKATITAKIVGTSIKSSCTVTVDISSLYVDLGLPSGTLWATMNVGANSPEEYGGYYAWGETKAYGEEDTSNTHNYSYNNNNSYIKTYYDWATYKWNCGTTKRHLTKYNTDDEYAYLDGTVDNKTTLDLADDAAYVNWGTNWRMPTSTEIKELINNCTCTWTTMNGVNGFKMTSKKDTSKSIFFPAAGDRYHSSLYNAGKECYYWSRDCSISDAYFLYYDSSYSEVGRACIERNRGYSVRPVRR